MSGGWPRVLGGSLLPGVDGCFGLVLLLLVLLAVLLLGVGVGGGTWRQLCTLRHCQLSVRLRGCGEI